MGGDGVVAGRPSCKLVGMLAMELEGGLAVVDGCVMDGSGGVRSTSITVGGESVTIVVDEELIAVMTDTSSLAIAVAIDSADAVTGSITVDVCGVDAGNMSISVGAGRSGATSFGSPRVEAVFLEIEDRTALMAEIIGVGGSRVTSVGSCRAEAVFSETESRAMLMAKIMLGGA